MTIAKDIRKSRFIEVLAVEGSDRFDFIRGGTNMAISFQNLMASAGVSGPLQPLGEITGIPVLNVDAGINYIRNIFSGPGVAASLSPQNGVQLEHNFTVSQSGVPIMINVGSLSPIIRSIRAGTGITVGGSGSEIQIATSGTPGSTKTVQIFTEDDLPEPVAGVITLEDNTEYFFLNDVTTANRFIYGNNCVLKGSDAVIITLTYTGSGILFTSVDKGIKIQDLKIICATGTLFDISSSTSTHIFRGLNLTLTAANGGNLHGMAISFLFNVVATFTTSGFTFTGTHKAALFSTMSITQAGSQDVFALGTAVFDSFTLDKTLFVATTSGYILSGAAASANLSANGLGTIFNCQQLGSSTFLGPNISSYDDRWEMLSNPTIVDSMDLALAHHTGGSITITGTNVPVLVGATWVSDDMHRFTHNANGQWTYNGKGTHVSITFSISGAAASVSDTYTFYLYKNGVQITASAISRQFTTSVGSLALVWSLQLAKNDYIELWVEDNTGIRNFVVSKIVVRMRS